MNRWRRTTASTCSCCRLELLSTEVSSLEDDEGAQCSNLQAIAMVENESRRYVTPTLVITNDNTNNLFSKIEKERIKRKARRYPSYGHLRGKYSLFNNTHLRHEYLGGKYSLINTKIHAMFNL